MTIFRNFSREKITDMLHWIPYAFIRVFAAFVAGTLSGIYWREYLPLPYAIIGACGLVIGYCLLHRFVLKSFFFSLNPLFSLTAFAAIFLMGYINVIYADESREKNHLLQSNETVTHYQAVVIAPGEEKTKTTSYLMEMKSYKTPAGWQEGKGKIRLYVANDPTSTSWRYGDILLIKGQPKPIDPPRNPGEFDYKRFLSFQHIHHQHFAKPSQINFVRHELPSQVIAYGYTLRAWAVKQLTRYVPDTRELNIALALVLGVKDGLDNDIKNAYAASGAMHVLAVSGLHAGIIYAIVLLLFGKLQHTTKGKWVLALISLTILWAYAMITGFSPSVLRAVTMFSFIAIARASNRMTNIYNTLAASAFLLLLFNPYLIVSVGFQLSYLAVTGIIYVQPRLYKLWYFENKLMDKVWAISSVALAAQLATAPLAILYFHQFPTFFLLSNLAVIPGAFLILCLGLSVLAMSAFPWVAELIGYGLTLVVYVVNEAVFAIQNLPMSQVTGLYITPFQSWLIIGAIVMLLLTFHYRRFWVFYTFFLLCTLFVSYQGYAIYQASQQQSVTIYRVNNHTAIAFIRAQEAYLYTDSSLLQDEQKIGYHIKGHHLQTHISQVHAIDQSMPFLKKESQYTLAGWDQKSLLILDQPIHNTHTWSHCPHVDGVLITRKFNKNIDWIVKHLKFGQLIFDGSLSWYQAEKYKKEAETLGLSFRSVYHDGAVVL